MTLPSSSPNRPAMPDDIPPSTETAPRRPQRGAVVVAVAVGLALFAAGVAAGHYAPAGWWPFAARPADANDVPPDAWRDAVAGSFALTTSQTLLAMRSAGQPVAKSLAIAAKELKLDLSPGRLTSGGLSPERVIFYRFDGRWLLEIDYLDAENGPIALSILDRPGEAAGVASELRRGMNVAYWSSPTHAFLFVGRAPDSILAERAKAMAQQLGP